MLCEQLRPATSDLDANTEPPHPARLHQRPAPGLVIAACSWAALGGLVSMHETGGVRVAALLAAAWPPVVVLLASMRGTHPRGHWRRMGAGVATLAAAASVEAILRLWGWADPSEETIADLLFLAGYLLIASGIWSLLRRHGRDDIRAGIADVLVMLLPAVVLLTEYVVHVPTVTVGGAAWPLRLLAATYPLMDVVLLAALVWLVATPTLTRAHLGLLTAGMALTLLVDLTIASEVLSPDEDLRRVVEGLYPLTWTLLASGVATGAAVRYGRQRTSDVVHWGRIGVLAFGAVLGPLIIVVAAMPPEPLNVIYVAIAVVISSSWIVWRMLHLARFLGVTTQQLARARQELQVQATHDPLTGLLNRAVLDEVLEGLEDPEVRPAALFSIDLDLFKSVNDTFGHAAGDRVLAETAGRLRSVVRPSDLVLRMGGDEFLVAMVHISAAEADRLAERIVRTVEQPIDIGDREVRIAASVGVAMMEADPLTQPAAASVARADAAMYRAKRTDSGHSGAVSQAPARTSHPYGPLFHGGGATTGAGPSARDDAAPGDTAGTLGATVGADDDDTQRPGTRDLDTKR